MPTPTAPWDRVYNDTKIVVGAVSDALFEQVLFQVCKDFFDKTNLWTESVPISVSPNVFSYTFSLAHKGRPNRLLLFYDPAINDPDRKWVTTNVQMAVPGTITIGYSPSAAATWNAIVGKICGDPVTGAGYPDMESADYWIIDKYRDALVAGVLGRLLLMPAKVFTNVQAGGMYRQLYITERGKARQDANAANVYGGQRWMYPQGWASWHRGGWA